MFANGMPVTKCVCLQVYELRNGIVSMAKSVQIRYRLKKRLIASLTRRCDENIEEIKLREVRSMGGVVGDTRQF